MIREGSIYLCEEKGEHRCLTKCKYKGTKRQHSFCPDFTNIEYPISFREELRNKQRV